MLTSGLWKEAILRFSSVSHLISIKELLRTLVMNWGDAELNHVQEQKGSVKYTSTSQMMSCCSCSQTLPTLQCWSASNSYSSSIRRKKRVLCRVEKEMYVYVILYLFVSRGLWQNYHPPNLGSPGPQKGPLATEGQYRQREQTHKSYQHSCPPATFPLPDC